MSKEAASTSKDNAVHESALVAPPPLERRSKSSWRTILKEMLAKSEQQKRQADPVLLEQLVSFIETIVPVNSIFARLDELRVDTYLRKKPYQFVYPRIEQEGQLAFYIPHSANSFVLNKWGILEPNPSAAQRIAITDIPFMLIPGLAFDREFTRLGRGQGFYDRVLQNYQGLKLGVCLSEQLVTTPLPREEHDMKMDIIVTEQYFIKRVAG
jgi:5-formyltetrahydrofolate cyclo-ligase